MNPIFPSEPAKVNVHLLPSEAEFISYSLNSQTLDIRAWMPANYSKLVVKESETQQFSNFFGFYCDGCHRNTRSYFNEKYPELFDEDGDLISYSEGDLFFAEADRIGSECSVWWRGFNGQFCLEGHEFTPKNSEAKKISNMVFDIKLKYKGSPPRFKKVYRGDNAHLKAGYVKNGEIYETRAFSASNVYSGDYLNDPGYTYGPICWGGVNTPSNLRSVVDSYFQSNFNNDLLRISTFSSNIDELETIKMAREYHKSNHKFICSGYDAMILIDADQDVQAFFTMLMAGFTSIPEAPHVMMVPVKTSTIQKGDSMYFGYTTQKDSVGREWYISSEGYLIGQLDESFVTV